MDLNNAYIALLMQACIDKTFCFQGSIRGFLRVLKGAPCWS